MVQHTVPRPAGPTTTTPALRPGVLRRTTHVDAGPGEGTWWGRTEPVRLRFEGVLCDRRATTDGAVILSRGELTAQADAGRRLVHLATDPPVPEGLVGERVGSGFRRRVEAAGVTVDHPALPLLTDLPNLALVSGFAEIRTRLDAGAEPAALLPPETADRLEEVCVGWAREGTLMTHIRSGRGLPLHDTPPAPDLDGAASPAGQLPAWHDLPPLRSGWLRRRRRIDLGPSWVDAAFRDSFADPRRGEVVVHEYTLRLELDADGRVRDAVAIPRVLPYPECPAAVAWLVRLRGTPLGELREVARRELAGTAGCTHLTDLLCSIGDAARALHASWARGA